LAFRTNEDIIMMTTLRRRLLAGMAATPALAPAMASMTSDPDPIFAGPNVGPDVFLRLNELDGAGQAGAGWRAPRWGRY